MPSRPPVCPSCGSPPVFREIGDSITIEAVATVDVDGTIVDVEPGRLGWCPDCVRAWNKRLESS